MSDSQEEPSDDRPGLRPVLPGAIRAAGMLWALVGAFFVLGSCGGAVASVAIQAQQPGPMRPDPTAGCTMWLGILIGAGFFVAGTRLARGSAGDTLLTAILSILVGLLYLVVGAFALRIASDPPPRLPDAFVTAMLISGILGVVLGCALLLPAGLALAARTRYLEWRAAVLSPRRRRRRRPESDEERL